MAHSRSRPLRHLAFFSALLGILANVAPALAQPPPSDPPQMCGDGTTFTVELPGTSLGIDDTDGLFRSIDVPDVAQPDSVTLPNGCRIYAIFISGYGNNRQYNDIPFFKVAEFVAKHDGYVHTGWWNNFTKEYAAGPLHPEDIVIEPFSIFGIPLGETVEIGPTPATTFDVSSFVPGTSLIDRPKANPDDDFQFQSDARLVIQAIRANNPDAIIVVAGHSMGGNAVARLGMTPDVPIDLLAPIDPVGNRDSPRGILGLNNYNWTRWRVANKFRGYKQWDCVRTGGLLNLCRDFDSRLFHASYHCEPVGDWLPIWPVFTSRAPVACPKTAPYIDAGTRLTIGANVRYLYHRWQHEFFWPVDFTRIELFLRPPSQPWSLSLLGGNYQLPVLPQLNLLDPDPARTCYVGVDPRDASVQCHPDDGHGEIIGHRGRGDSETRLALFMRNWPGRDEEEARRAKMVELVTTDDTWQHRPVNPDLCMVCDDMITIIDHLLSLQPPSPTEEDETAPVSTASTDPGPGPVGWNNEDVVVSVTATDGANGSGVQEIEIALTGAQTGSTTTPGGSAQVTITAEGLTSVSYFASDEAGNAEGARALDVRIDKTSPEVSAVTDIPPNAHEWIGAPVVVSFPASDEAGGSGLASASPDVTVSSEGAGQEVSGTAEDNAGNTASAAVTLNLDLTPPGIALDSRVPGPNAAGWNGSAVTVTWNCSDTLSGVSAAQDSVVLGTEGAGQSAIGTCRDLADHVSTDTHAGINIDLTSPGVSLATPPQGAAYLLDASHTAAFGCTDALSGVASCAGTAANGALLDTSSVGSKSFTVAARDAADNTSAITHQYAVHYQFPGFGMPIQAGLNRMKAGRTVPVKYSLRDANGAFISNLASFVSIRSEPVVCGTDEATDVLEDADGSGHTTIRYDADANQFIFDWKTDGSWTGTCRVLRVTLDDGTEHLAMFRFQ